MAIIAGNTTTRLAEVGTSFKGLLTSEWPQRCGFRLAGRATNVTLTNGLRAFAFRWPSAVKACVVTYFEYIQQEISNAPSAELEVGFGVYVVRNWNVSGAPASGANVVVLNPTRMQSPRTAGEYQSLLVTTGAAYDIRFVISTGAGSTVTSPTDNFVADTNPLLVARQKELIQAAGNQKSQDIRASFGLPAGVVNPNGVGTREGFSLREQPYPLVLSEYEGLIVQVEPGNVGLADCAIAMEWYEIPYERLDTVLPTD